MPDDFQAQPSPGPPPAAAPPDRYADLSFRKSMVQPQQLICWACLGAFLIVAALLLLASVLFAAPYWPAERLDDCAPTRDKLE